MKRSELTNQQKLLVPCPICAAAIGVHCQMYSGFGRRNEAHSERKYYAIEAIEHGYARYELLRTLSGLKAVIFGKLLAVRSTHNRSARPLPQSTVTFRVL
jgi:hypothetical protein